MVESESKISLSLQETKTVVAFEKAAYYTNVINVFIIAASIHIVVFV